MNHKHIGISLALIIAAFFVGQRSASRSAYDKAMIEGCQKVVNQVTGQNPEVSCIMKNGDLYVVAEGREYLM